MNFDKITNQNVQISLKNIKLNDSPNKSLTKQTDNLKQTIKIPQGAKKIGNYILGKTIGSGTFGKVHIGMHVLTGEKVAVKIIQKQKIQGKDIQRVKNQIQILRTTRHRNIIHLYQIIQTQKSLLLITQYLANGQLFGKIVKQKKYPNIFINDSLYRISQKQACHIFQQIISGIQYLHRMRIAHRDMKPQNLMIDYDNQIKIIDFGLSRVYNKYERLTSSCGSPCYASPEMIENKAAYDPEKNDVWSCAVVLYSMVCGSLPFLDTDIPKLYKKIVSGVYRPLKDVSYSLKDLIEKILITNPDKRLSIKQIKSHQWWNTVPQKKGYGLYKDQKVAVDLNIVMKTVALGFQKSKIIQSLQNDLKNKQTGTYYILMKKIVKSGLKVPKYIGDQNFDPDFIEDNNFQQQFSDTAVSTPQCNLENGINKPSDGPNCTCTENTKPFQWWVYIGTKQYENPDSALTEKEVDALTSFLNSILQRNVNVNKFKLSPKRRFLRSETNEIKQKQDYKKCKEQFYGFNSILCKSIVNIKNHSIHINIHKNSNQLIPYQQKPRLKSVANFGFTDAKKKSSRMKTGSSLAPEKDKNNKQITQRIKTQLSVSLQNRYCLPEINNMKYRMSMGKQKKQRKKKCMIS